VAFIQKREREDIMRNTTDPQSIAAIIAAVENACGSTVPDARREQLLQQVGQLLVDDNESRRPIEHKQVSILLSDLRGFTAITERCSASDVIALLNRYFSRMCEVIFRYHGTVDKFMGDGIMVLFGAPETGRDDLMRAIACATEMQQVMSDVNRVNRDMGMPELFMGIGINTGEVVAASVGSDLHREYTVIGDHVNLASRIEPHSLRGQVLLSEHSYRLAKEFIDVGDVREVLVKGKREPVKLYELIATSLPKPMRVPRREIRKSPRVPTNMPLTFQLVQGKQVLPQMHRGQMMDISYSGMLLRLSDRVPVDSEMKFSLSLSMLSPEVTDIYARVLRVAELPDDYECSLEFTTIDDIGQNVVREFVDRAVT
jgi:adenylate cyclase